MTKNVEVIFKYVLLNIYTRQWQQGAKIPSKKAFAIKFNCSVGEVMQALSKLKQNGFVNSVERFGYYVSQNPHSYFFYSISDFYFASEVKTSILNDFNLPHSIIKIIKSQVGAFKTFITSPTTTFKRQYYYSKKVEKEAYFIFDTNVFKQFKNPKLLHKKPLYEFLALNGLISAHNKRFAFFSDLPAPQPDNLNQRCWVVVEFVYDINNQPLAILFINYFDHKSNHILYKRNDGIYK